MEVSSHALALHRVDGTRFDAAVFTNLGRDHLDLHGTIEEYFGAKARLFDAGAGRVGVVNVDDAHGRLLARRRPPIEMRAVLDWPTPPTSSWTARSPRSSTWRRTCGVTVPLGGRVQRDERLAAATTAAALGVDADVIVAGLAAAEPVPGPVRAGRAADGATTFAVIVDYAHTPDGLAEVLAAARADRRRRRPVIVVFGGGGDRDREKRPRMGAVAAGLADRGGRHIRQPALEDPVAIIDAILGGVDHDDRGRVVVEPDRRAAIAAGHRRAPTRATSSSSPARATRRRRRSATASSPFDDRAVRHASSLDADVAGGVSGVIAVMIAGVVGDASCRCSARGS